MAVYNTSFMDNATGPLDLILGFGRSVAETNNVSSYILGNTILGMIFILTLIYFMKQDNLTEATLISSFLTTFAAIFLASSGFILWSIVVWPFIVLVISTIMFFIR